MPRPLSAAGPVFVKSSANLSQCPKPDRPEFAFIGRSNVGKSSLINMLTGVRNLAKTSSTPGKTQLINHYLVEERWYMVDLPGYGYASLSKKDREALSTMIESYLTGRDNLMNIYLLVDSRHEPQAIDLEFMEWLAVNGLPFTIVFTKSDKLNRQELARSLSRYRKALEETWEELPPFIITSSEEGMGKKELLSDISSIRERF